MAILAIEADIPLAHAGIALIREIPITMVTATREVNLKVNYTGIRARPVSRRISGTGGTKRAKC